MMSYRAGPFLVISLVSAIVALLFWQDLGLAIIFVFVGVALAIWMRMTRDALRERDELRAQLREMRSTGAWEGVQSGSPALPERCDE